MSVESADLEKGFHVGQWRVRPRAGLVERGRLRNNLEPRAMQVLLQLAARPNQFVTRDDLFDAVWAGRCVTDDCLTGAVRAIRKALGDDSQHPAYIQTRKNVGYRLIARVRSSPRWRRVVAMVTGIAITIVAALWAWQQPASVPLPPAQSLAVLPFTNLSPDRDYLAEVLSDGLTTELGRQSLIRVIARDSVLPYRDSRVAPAVLARNLGADLLVTGTVLASKERIRVNAQLVDPRDDTQLWARSFDRPLGDLLTLQSELSASIASQIGAELKGRAIASDLTGVSLQELLKARYFLASGTPEHLNKAADGFARLVAENPHSPAAHLGLAQAQLELFKSRSVDVEDLDAALGGALLAEKLGGQSAVSHKLVGQILLFLHWDFQSAEDRYRQSLALNPSDAIARRRYAWLLVAQNRHAEAEGQLDQIRLLHPLYYASPERAILSLYMGRVDQAIVELVDLNEAVGPDRFALRALFTAYLAKGQEANAADCLRQMLVAGGWIGVTEIGLFSAMGTPELLRHILEHRAFDSPVAAAGYANLLGEHELAIDYLHQAVAQHDPAVFYIDSLPELKSLKGYPGFARVLATVGLAGGEPLAFTHPHPSSG